MLYPAKDIQYVADEFFTAMRRIVLTTPEMTDDEKTVRFNFLAKPSLLEGLDELRRAEPGTLPTRAEMLRRLIERALDAKRKR
jgi:hypothetical protein